ncbi:MAG: hypothetical protein R3F65_18385 [bacterium]
MLDLRAGLTPIGAPIRLPLARPIAVAATATETGDGPPDLAGYLRHLAHEWGRVPLHGLVRHLPFDLLPSSFRDEARLTLDQPAIELPEPEAT